jgi:hypothetical protein
MEVQLFENRRSMDVGATIEEGRSMEVLQLKMGSRWRCYN